MSVQQSVPENAPVMQAWKAHQKTEDYSNSLKWAVYPEHAEGSLWALFCAGYSACAIAMARDHLMTQQEHDATTDAIDLSIKFAELADGVANSVISEISMCYGFMPEFEAIMLHAVERKIMVMRHAAQTKAAGIKS